jgi:hypothetical protein
MLFLIACGDIIDHSTKLNEIYHVDTIDLDEDRSLYWSYKGGGGVGRVNNGVVAVGLNDRYIIVKQHINDIDSYSILDMTKDSIYAEPSDSVYGP